jgi:S-adenosylmethionine:tRNA ribosyltransferase-isomerase
MLVSDFHFELPPELIAQRPPAERGSSRMLVMHRESGMLADRSFADLAEYLHAGDVLVLNNSRVIPARLFATRGGLTTQPNSPVPSGSIEVLLTQPLGDLRWRALVKPAKKVQVGETLRFCDASGVQALMATVVATGEYGERTLEFQRDAEDFFSILERIGHMPLPPYMHREEEAADRERYQTTFHDPAQPGSAAAPTAGLHFTPQRLAELARRGVEVHFITLHVGLGTFQPVRVEQLADIHLHEEPYTLPPATAAAITLAKSEARRVIAVGTTTVRTLEHCALVADGRPLTAHSGTTSIFIAPGFHFRVVDALLTNFHLPQSTLLMLVSAFAAAAPHGRELALAAYAHAVREQYRFFSYGDCMLLV